MEKRLDLALSLEKRKRPRSKKLLVKTVHNHAESKCPRIKMDSISSAKEEYKSKKMKPSATLSDSSDKSKSCNVVLPSIVKIKKQRIFRMPSQDDLWKSIKSNYFFIMNNNLISECQKTRKELSLCSPRLSPASINNQQPISFPEFVERFNALHDRLHILFTSLEDCTKEHDFNDFQSEMDLLGGEYTFLLDQASILQRLDPELKDDVSRRCTILKNKWEVLESAMWPRKKRENHDRTKSLTAEIRNIRKWLRGVEEKLRRLKASHKSSPDEVANIYNEEKVLQREIEERGREINSLVRRCQATTKDGATRLHRQALHLERNWHHIWIRSLETQCLTEQHLLRQQQITAAVTAHQSTKESTDLDSDEGPLRKHRRLTLDHWTAVSATMDRLKKQQQAIIKRDGMQTRDVGVLCSEKVPVNDKCIMVGTTGIAALKAEYGDDFTNFEIIQDVGYSSESSTHLSGDDTGQDYHRIFKYTKDNQPTPLSLREELESLELRDFHSWGSSLESSSSAAASLDDSGLGTGENLTTGESGDAIGQFRVDDDDYGQEELDYLETVLDECVDFGANVVSDPEELHFNLSGLDSDDPSDNFQNRSSFTTSAQVFYKMISVDSDNGEADANGNESVDYSSAKVSDNHQPNSENDASSLNNNPPRITNYEDHLNKNTTSDSDPETFKPVQPNTISVHSNCSDSNKKNTHRFYCSTPKQNENDYFASQNRHHHGLKRKRGYENLDTTRMSHRVRSWLNRCSDISVSSRIRKPISRMSPDQNLVVSEDVSSGDASCEGTSSSADEGNVYSSWSSFYEDDVFKCQKSRVDSYEGSVETVVHALLDSEFPFLLPPPPSSTASFGSSSNRGSTIQNRVKKRNRKLKASSDGDIEKRKNLMEFSNFTSHHVLRKKNPSKSTTHSGDRLHSSLPSVLRHSSDSSTDDNCVLSAHMSHSDTKTTALTTHSSSSEFGRQRHRRSRKKSSSSNRSSTSAFLSSGDRSRHRSRTVTSSTSRCGSRRRHVSQRSEFYCPDTVSSDEGKSPLKVEISPVKENDGFEDLCHGSSALLSPAESDIVLTQLEEQSTVSDQVWDGYQEMPYLSEGYSEATVDEDAVRKLTEFGDDYGSAIGQPLRLLESADGNNNNKKESSKSPKKCSKSIPVTARLASLSDDSDSDSEDLYYVIEEAGKALQFARTILQRRKSGDTLTSADYAELLATCSTHLRCLQTICKHIDGKEHNFSASHLKQLHYLIEAWQELKRNIEMFERCEDTPARQKYLKAQENIDALFNKMSQLSSYSYLDVSSLSSWEDIQKNMARLQMVLSSLQEAKDQLLSVNLQVHRFTTEYSDDENYKDCSLKDDVTELYRQWEDTYEQNGAQLTELETLKTDWEVYNEKLRTLRLRIKEAEFGANEDICDNSNLNCKRNDTSSFRKDLGDLKQTANLLESRLMGGDAWKTIQEDLRDLQSRIRILLQSPQRTAFTSENHRSPSSRIQEDADDHFEDAIQQLYEDKNNQLSTPQKKDIASPSVSPKSRKGRFWRIVRVAVPVQFALVLLYCLACYLEPSCCNALNNFNFSFTPQLRYLGGRPPV